MMRLRAAQFSTYIFSLVVLLLTVSAPSSAQAPGAPSFNVLTWQIDHGRTGQNLREGVLTSGTVSSTGGKNFGQLCHANLDGQVYAQPLVVTNVTINANGTAVNYPSVAYVVTQYGTMYAISGTPPPGTHGSQTTCTVIPNASNTLTGTSLLFSRYPAYYKNLGGGGGLTIKPYVSILGTPVINATVVIGQPTTGTLYVVVETQDVPPADIAVNYQHWLYAIDISSLQVTGQVQIYPPSANTQQKRSLFSQSHIQRPGLLYANGYVYAAFSLMDGNGIPGPNGAVFRYTASNLTGTYSYFPTTPDIAPAGGGVWQDGAGLAFWTNGTHNYIFFNTGNGNFTGTLTTPCSTECGDSFIKLDADTMTVADSFTPYDQFYRSSTTCPPLTGNGPNGDVDWGSGGVLLIPDNELATGSNLAVSGDKEGGIWVQNRSSLGKYNGGTGGLCDSQCSCTSSDNVVQMVWTGTAHAGNEIHTTPGYWESGNGSNYMYVATQSGAQPGSLNQYSLCTATVPICSSASVPATDPTGATINFGYGATPAASASGQPATAALLWAIFTDGNVEGTTPGILYAFDAVSMKQLYASSGLGNTCSGDTMNSATKFSLPTVANGNVYVGTQSNNVTNMGMGTFYIFGLNRGC